MKNVLIVDPLWSEMITDEDRQLLEREYKVRVLNNLHEYTEFAQSSVAKSVDIMVVNPDVFDWKITLDTVKQLEGLKLLITESTSHSWLDLPDSIKVVNVVNFSTRAVAEWVVMQLFLLSRKVPEMIKAGFPLDYKDDYITYCGENIQNKTVGIIGMGHIGHEVAGMCTGLGLKVIYWSQKSTYENGDKLAIDDVFKQCDVLVPALEDNAATRKVITNELIDSLKPGAHVINITHGLLCDNLLIKKVADGQLSGYGYETKNIGDFSKYSGNIWSVPAYAWCTRQSLEGVVAKVVEILMN